MAATAAEVAQSVEMRAGRLGRRPRHSPTALTIDPRATYEEWRQLGVVDRRLGALRKGAVRPAIPRRVARDEAGLPDVAQLRVDRRARPSRAARPVAEFPAPRRGRRTDPCRSEVVA